MRYFVDILDQVYEVEVDGDQVLLDGRVLDARLRRGAGGGVASLRMGRRSHAVVDGGRTGDVRTVHVNGAPFRAQVVDERTRRVRAMSGAAAGASGPKPIKAPMPGLVVKVEVEVGQKVAPGDGVVIVEAMKMENELVAEVAAVVAHVLVEPGQAVEKDQVLVDFTAADAEEAAE